jgi:hypothetical protein
MNPSVDMLTPRRMLAGNGVGEHRQLAHVDFAVGE